MEQKTQTHDKSKHRERKNKGFFSKLFLLRLAAREQCGRVGSWESDLQFPFYLITVLRPLKRKQKWVGFPVLGIQELRTRLRRWKFRTVSLVRSKPPQVLFFYLGKRGEQLNYDSKTLLGIIVLSLK